MPFFLVTVGLIMIVTAARNTHAAFAAQVQNDFINQSGCAPTQKQFAGCGFLYWLIAIGAVGAIGYSDKARSFSNAFLALIVIVMLLANQKAQGGGFFAQLMDAINQGPNPAPPPTDNSCNFNLSDLFGSGSKVSSGSSAVDNFVNGLVKLGLPGRINVTNPTTGQSTGY